jgi:hypothetical protein
MVDSVRYEWSHVSNIGSIDSGDSVSYSIYVERVETTITPAVPPETEERFFVDDLKFEQIIQDESDYLPDGVTISNENTSVDISGPVKVPPQFVELAYSDRGVSYQIQTIEELPKGARAYKLIPDDKEYKYYQWKVYAQDEENPLEEDPVLVERSFTLEVAIDFNDTKTVIQRIVSEIE